MNAQTILGQVSDRPQADTLAALGTRLLQIKCARRLTLEDMGMVLGRTRESIAQYIAGEAEMGVVAYLRAVEKWPELAGDAS